MKLRIQVFILIVYLNLLPFTSNGNFKDTTSIAIEKYKEASIVASGIVIGTEEIVDNGTGKVQIELYAIYKGVRRTYLFVISDTLGVQKFKINQVYLVYAKITETGDFVNLRNILIHEKIKNEELEEVKSFVKSKFFRRIKKPMPQYFIETQGCGDCF